MDPELPVLWEQVQVQGVSATWGGKAVLQLRPGGKAHKRVFSLVSSQGWGPPHRSTAESCPSGSPA